MFSVGSLLERLARKSKFNAMAVENEGAEKEVCFEKDSDDHPDGIGPAGNTSTETVVLEPEFEKKSSTTIQVEHAKGEIDLDSFEIQVEDEEEVDDVALSKVTQKQSNTYAAKKTVAQGMMDIALITANANQLRYIIEFNSNSSTYYLNLFLITVSLLLQVGVGVSLIFKGRMDLRGESKHRNAKRINNHVVVGIFLVTIINVFIASFTITGSQTANKQ